MKSVLRCVLALAVLAWTASPSWAWSRAGHMATGAMAYRVLKKDSAGQKSPTTLDKALAILKEHPYYEEKWKARIDALAPEDDKDEFLFMLAAQWPDEAIGDEDFYPQGGSERMHHFINRPFKPVGQPATVVMSDAAEENILRAFPMRVKMFKNTPDLGMKAVALAWVMHLTGDSHQPLHSASLFTEKFQLKQGNRVIGDRGGTLFFVIDDANPNGVSLHHIWDGLVTQKSKYRDNRNAVIKLMEDFPADKFTEQVKVLKIDDWIDESFELAKTKAYCFNGNLIDGGTKQSEAKALPDGYFAAIEPIGKERGVLAGYRMAATIKEMLK